MNMIAMEIHAEAQQKMAAMHQGNPGNTCKLMETDIALRQHTEGHFALKTDVQKEQKVRDIAADNNDKSCFAAQNMLKLAFEEKYRELLKMPTQNQNKMGYPDYDNEAEKDGDFALLDENHKLRCFPNPFSSFTTIEAFVPEGITQAKVIVFSILGIAVKEYPVHEGYNALTVLNEDLPEAGVYFYALYGYGKLLEKDKLVIIK